MDFIELGAVPKALKSFEKMCGLKLTIYDLGNTLSADHQSLLPPDMLLHTHSYCSSIKEFSIQRCYSSCKFDVLKHFDIKNDIFIKRCHAEVNEVTIPVFVDDKLFCIAFMGPFVIDSEVDRVPNLNDEEVEDVRNLAELLQAYLESVIEQVCTIRNRNIGERAAGILSFIDENFEKPIGIADLAEYIGLSESRTIHLVREVTSKSFVEILTEKRIKRGLKYLEQSSESVAEIARKIGFSTSSYFCTVFRKRLGMTPAEYRKKMI